MDKEKDKDKKHKRKDKEERSQREESRKLEKITDTRHTKANTNMLSVSC
jgi:hypothetical protein